MPRKSLEYYLSRDYPFRAEVDEDGGYVVIFPDLPGCMTQVETLADLPEMARDALNLWLETEYERGAAIPDPSAPPEYSGRFNVRIPRSLHRRLAESAERDGVSLNTYVVALLERGDAQGHPPVASETSAPERARRRSA